ncbi:MAG: alkaline phosphatase D family protein [Corynebacterium provencense]|uniref:alkaline phosphatase D family protein n=1 Tax=Corynebacterium provencense TaxID=1737425 RepID=UPI00298A051B|nr:alkaline phosphatase D family protein [Corynebacterium provencense]
MSPYSRRSFLTGATALGVLTYAAGTVNLVSANVQGATGFLHSVASGDPLPDAVVLWTRVTPSPDAVPGSGLGSPVTVKWEVSTSPGFTETVNSGEVTTDASADHTVKVDATGLQPSTDYFYRFTVVDGPATGTVSRTGRARTAPAVGADPGSLRFGVCSCANYEAGYFRAYREMADRDDLEFTLHLGDFTYEYATGEYGAMHETTVRRVQPANRTTSLSDYRIRQGHYHRDADLADLLAARPLIAIWDDHEFADNTWRDGATGNSIEPGDDFAAMKAAATQAYLEWMPLRGVPAQRHLRFGTLAELIIPDLRSYRDEQQEIPAAWRGSADPARTMMGRSQFDWFADVLTTSDTRWQLIGNEVMFAPMTLPDSLDPRIHDWLVEKTGIPADGLALNADQWDGYMAERQRIIDLIVGDGSVPARGGVVFLTGDIHSSWAADIPANAGDWRLGRNTRAAATEFVTPSVTAASAFDGIATSPALDAPVAAVLSAGEQILRQVDNWFRYVDLSRHGYMAVDVDANRVQVDWHHGDVLTPDAPLAWSTSYQAVHGSPGARPVGAPLPR